MRVEHYLKTAKRLEKAFEGVSRELYHGDCYCEACKSSIKAIKADRTIKVYRNINKGNKSALLPFSKEVK